MTRHELTSAEVKDALTRLAEGLMDDPMNRIELRAIAVMLMNDADAVAGARYQPREIDAEKIERLGNELVTVRMQLAAAQGKADASASQPEREYRNAIGALQQHIEERDQALTRIGVVMGTMRTHFRNAETRRREVMELLSQDRRNAKETVE